MDMSRAIEARTARQREQQQAVARPARIRFYLHSEGTGAVRLVGADSLAFNAWMLEEPSFSFGVVSAEEEPLAVEDIPLATATVLGWRMLDGEENLARGEVWLGADLAFRVESNKPDIKLRFSLTFEGYTMRSFIETN